MDQGAISDRTSEIASYLTSASNFVFLAGNGKGGGMVFTW